MEPSNHFLERMGRLADEKLISILTKERKDYQEKALVAAETVLKQRNVTFELIEPIEKPEEEEPLSFVNIEKAGIEQRKFELEIVQVGDEYLEEIEAQKRSLWITIGFTVPIIVGMSVFRIGFAGLGLPVLIYVLRLVFLIKATHQKSVELKGMIGIKEEIESIQEEISPELEEKAKRAFKLLVSAQEDTDKKDELVQFFEKEISSKEELFDLETAIKLKFYKNLQYELMNTSNAYSIIKTMMYPYIKFGLVEGEYPHKRIG